jgi:hypothetical protein
VKLEDLEGTLIALEATWHLTPDSAGIAGNIAQIHQALGQTDEAEK